MSEAEDPSRLADDASMPSGLRDTLRAARGDVGSDAQIGRLAARLGPLLGAGIVPGSAASGPTATSAGIAGSTKLGLAGLALVVAGGAAWLVSTKHTEPAALGAAKSVVVTSSPAPTVEAPLAAPAATVDVAPAPEPSAAPLPAKPVAKALSEAELLEQARSALRSDPARALSRANEHRARFARGVLVQEREVIAIQALRQLGRTAEADKRAEAFSKAFPGSAFQRKLKTSP